MEYNYLYKFTGKERDSESGLDNFGARYNSSSLGRFMSPDPDNEGAIDIDPQTWNRYSYARNNPLIYIDPDGAAVEFIGATGEEREKALEEIKKGLSKEAAFRLYINEIKAGDKIRYFLGIQGHVEDFKKLSETANDLGKLVADKRVVEFGLTNENLKQYGGAVTYDKGEVGNQNVRVLINPSQAVAEASQRTMTTLFGRLKFAGQSNEPPWIVQPFTKEIVVWHELGHGWAKIHSAGPRTVDQEGVNWENRMRQQVYGPLGPKNAARRRD